MREINREALAAACAEKVKHLEFAVAQSAFGEVRQELETELAIARVALLALRKERERAEPDYIRYDCGCCRWETIEDWRDNDACPKCNHKPMGKTELYAAPPAPVAVGWIACSERMPDDGVSVLAYCKCGDNFSGIYTMRAPVIRSKNNRKDDSLVHHERVTHWMPLPEPPNEEE